jgi:purine-binding chemotaxis protein CheW
MADQGAERQLVVFDLAGEVYGVNIETVREIIRMQDVTYVPDAPEFVEGVINLRGRVIPVVDLRKRFSLTQSEATEESRVVVVDIGGEDIGVIVDAVTEVLRIAVDSIESTASLVTTEDSYYLEGIVKVDDGLLILLDIEQALAQGVEEMPELADVPA